MVDQTAIINIEIPSNIPQNDIWKLEEKLQQIEDMTTNLLESKDFATVTTLILSFAASIMGPIAVIGGGIKSIHEVAKIVYDFLHHTSNEKSEDEDKKKVILTKKGKRFEIYNLTIEEIENIIKEV